MVIAKVIMMPAGNPSPVLQEDDLVDITADTLLGGSRHHPSSWDRTTDTTIN